MHAKTATKFRSVEWRWDKNLENLELNDDRIKIINISIQQRNEAIKSRKVQINYIKLEVTVTNGQSTKKRIVFYNLPNKLFSVVFIQY